MSSNYYTTIPDQVKEEESYPIHVKRKLKAYENAGLKYLVANDSIMKRDIIFENKKRQSPNSYEKTIVRVLRLRDPSDKEYIIYDTLEKVRVEGQRYECNIQYGTEEYIESEDKTGPNGEFTGKGITTHENQYMIEYDAGEMKKILNSQTDKDNTPMMFLASTHKEIDALYTGAPTRIFDRNNFINMSYDELMIMALTKTATIEDALTAARITREEKTMLPEGSDKLRILEAARSIQNRTKK